MKTSTTIRLSDTIDHFARRVHINVRNGKATMVYRWKDRNSAKAHTQRMTLTDEQALRLISSLASAAVAAAESRGHGDKVRTMLGIEQ